MITSSFLKNFQRRKLEDATLTNGLFLQNETVSPIKDGTLLIGQRITLLWSESKLIINLFLSRRFGLPSPIQRDGHGFIRGYKPPQNLEHAEPSKTRPSSEHSLSVAHYRWMVIVLAILFGYMILKPFTWFPLLLWVLIYKIGFHKILPNVYIETDIWKSPRLSSGIDITAFYERLILQICWRYR